MNEFVEFLEWLLLISVVVGVAVGSLIRIGRVPAVARPIANPHFFLRGRMSTAGSGARLYWRRSLCRL